MTINREKYGDRRKPDEVLRLLCKAGDTLRGLRISVNREIHALLLEAIEKISQSVKLQIRLLPPPCLYVDENATGKTGRLRDARTGMKRRCRSTAQHNGTRKRGKIPC